MPALASSFTSAHASEAAGSPLRQRGGMENSFDDEKHRRLTEASINSFLEEEGVPVIRKVTAEYITAALLTLGYSVATASAAFAARIVLLRLDCLTAVEGELRMEASRTSSSGVRLTADASPSPRPPRKGAFGWLGHIYKEEKGVSGLLRGGKAELGFALATFAESALLVVAMRRLMERCGGLMPSQSERAGDSAVRWWAAFSRTAAPVLVTSLLSWPLRATRTAIRVNYMADTPLPTCEDSQQLVHRQGQQRRAHRYTGAAEVWGRIRSMRGVRSLLLNGLDVDLTSRALSLGLVWTVVQPASRWMEQVAMMHTSTTGAASAPSAFARLGQHRLFPLGVLMVVSVVVNAVQRPFAVLRQRMALLPVEDAESVCSGGDGQAKTPATALRGCRYANGWDCAVHVWRREGATGFLAGLPLCLITSSVVPLLQTLAGYPTAPSFTGAVM
ncbi:hypothetical protein LSCM1_04893 [Leishmania martiniquensis]|uniref:Mitochondrial carrier protein n=1 Tax=Leishmania martiniquensis TaxID=1580590 RepID=A0A836GXY8_9TRYP|nr:hypothetical protein LSCM1_04893 [Leishmania martiniquensis]